MIQDKNDPLIEKYLLEQMDVAGRERHKMELKNILRSQESGDITIGTSLLREIRQAAFSQSTMLSNEDLPVSQNTLDDFLDSDE